MPATEFFTPVSAGPDEVGLTIQKRTRLYAIHAARGASITLETQVASIDAATGNDRVVNSGPSVTRPLSAAVLAQTVLVGGQPVSLATLLQSVAKFYPVWRAEDIAAQTP